MKKNFKIRVVVFSMAISFLASINFQAKAQESGSYFSGHKGSVSMSELVQDIQILKANDISSPAPKPAGAPVNNAETEAEDSNEFIQFWDDLQEDVWQDICKAVQISLSEGVDLGDIVGIKGKFKRELKQYPDKRIALVVSCLVPFPS